MPFFERLWLAMTGKCHRLATSVVLTGQVMIDRGRMRATTSRLLLAILLGLSLAGCMQTASEQVATGVANDDAFCQKNGGPVGSGPYSACMKDRDVAAGNRQARMDRTHRRVSEDMLNGR